MTISFPNCASPPPSQPPSPSPRTTYLYCSIITATTYQLWTPLCLLSSPLSLPQNTKPLLFHHHCHYISTVNPAVPPLPSPPPPAPEQQTFIVPSSLPLHINCEPRRASSPQPPLPLPQNNKPLLFHHHCHYISTVDPAVPPLPSPPPPAPEQQTFIVPSSLPLHINCEPRHASSPQPPAPEQQTFIVPSSLPLHINCGPRRASSPQPPSPCPRTPNLYSSIITAATYQL